MEHLLVDNKKVSKRLGNFYSIRDLLAKGFNPLQIRYLLISTHYKTQLNFTFAGLDAAKNALNRVQDFILRMQELQKHSTGAGSVDDLIETHYLQFAEALGDDFNISQGLATLFDFIRQVNVLADENKISTENAGAILSFLQKINGVLGFLEFAEQEEIPADLVTALEQRLQARKDKNWALADQLRDLIHNRGFVIEDTASGARLKKGAQIS